MSLTSIVPYFDTKMQTLGYTEWMDEFNIDNIPRDILDRTYHVGIGTISSGPSSHTNFSFLAPIVVTVHSCPSQAMGSSDITNDMVQVAQNIVDEMCIIEDRYTSDLEQVYPVSINFEPISASNDNITRVRIEFGVQVNLEFRRVCP